MRWLSSFFTARGSVAALLCCASAMPCWAAKPVVAEPTPSGSAVGLLDVEAAVALALGRNPVATAARSAAQGAQAMAQSSSLINAPSLKWSADRDRTTSESPQPTTRNKLALAWAPPQWGERDLRQNQLRSTGEQYGHLAEQTQQQIAADVRRSYANLAMLEDMLEASEQARRVSTQRETLAAQQLQRGRKTKQELLDLKLLHQELDQLHQAMLLQQSQSRSRLLTLMGRGLQDPLSVQRSANPFGVAGSALDGVDLIATALQQRPEFKAVQARCAAIAADSQLKQLDNGRWLKSVEMNYTAQQTSKPANWGVTLEFNLPTAGSRNGNDVALQSALAVCRAQAEELDGAVRLEVEQARQQLAAATLEADRQVRELAPVHQSSVNLARASRQLGRNDATDVLGAELAQTRARISALQRLHEVVLAELALRHAVGLSVQAPPGSSGSSVRR